jgi:hypothetical protein
MIQLTNEERNKILKHVDKLRVEVAILRDSLVELWYDKQSSVMIYEVSRQISDKNITIMLLMSERYSELPFHYKLLL